MPGEHALLALTRDALAAPVRYQVVVVPGSGCAGMAPIADRYFAGLLHAQVLVLHKPGVDPQDWPAPRRCSRKFVVWDDLGNWLETATAALTHEFQSQPPSLPVVLVGISEGAELLPALAARFPQVRLLVMVGSAGLDPAQVASLQAERNHDERGWREVLAAAESDGRDSAVIQGRSLRYWRSLLRWRVQQPLLESPLPLLQAWGTADESVPQAAYQRFSVAMESRRAPYCALAIGNGDHGLQTAARDHVQDVWARVENWARGAAMCPTPSECLPGPASASCSARQ